MILALTELRPATQDYYPRGRLISPFSAPLHWSSQLVETLALRSSLCPIVHERYPVLIQHHLAWLYFTGPCPTEALCRGAQQPGAVTLMRYSLRPTGCSDRGVLAESHLSAPDTYVSLDLVVDRGSTYPDLERANSLIDGALALSAAAPRRSTQLTLSASGLYTGETLYRPQLRTISLLLVYALVHLPGANSQLLRPYSGTAVDALRPGWPSCLVTIGRLLSCGLTGTALSSIHT